MEMACYEYTPNGWRNCNADLNIRGITNKGNTINGSPTNGAVPRVYAYTSSGYKQIYPASEIPSGKITYTARKLNMYKYHSIPKSSCQGPGTSSRPKRGQGDSWGWSGDNKAAQGFYEQDYINSGHQDMRYVHFEHFGWLDLGSYARSKLPNANKVTGIRFLSFTMDRRSETGFWGSPLMISFGLNNVDECGNYPSGERAQNPFNNKVEGKVDIGTVSRGPGSKTLTVDLNSARGKQVANMFMKWMKGESKSIIMINDETCHQRDQVTSVCCSRHYTRINSFSMTIDYVTEG